MSEQQTGSWWGLDSVLKESRQEFDAYWDYPPIACPQCGEPLTPAPDRPSAGGIELFCRYDGWQYPRDRVRPSRLDFHGPVRGLS